MEWVAKLEKKAEAWIGSLKLPKLPATARRWIGENVWWVAAVLAILSGIGVLFALSGIFSGLAAMTALPGSWVVGAVTGWVVLSSVVSLVFTLADAVLLGMAVNPLQQKQRKGWDLLFIVLLVGALSIAVNALVSILTLNPLALIGGIVFGVLWLAIFAYILFEIRPEFAHVSKSAGVKAKTSKTKK